MLARIVVGLCLCVPLLAGCPDRELCEKACWNHYELTYKAELEKKLAELPEDERAAFREEKLEALAERKADEQDGKYQLCIENCTERGNERTVECWAEAETVEVLESCE